MDTQALLDLTDEWHYGDLQVLGWVILKVPGLAGPAGGSFSAQAPYLYHLWNTLQDPFLGDEDGRRILLLEDADQRSLLHNCGVV